MDHSEHMDSAHANHMAAMNLTPHTDHVVMDDHTNTGMHPSNIDHSTMDHSHHGHAHGSPTEQMVHHMMSMAFHGGCKETILFEDWSIDSVSGLLGSMLFIAIMAALYEGLKYYREHLFWRTYNALQYRPVTVQEKNGTPSTNNSNTNTEEGARVVHMVGEVIHKQPPTMFSVMHLYQTILHLLQVTLSFLLMLIFMTYNTYLCIAVVLGAAIGYFLFGWKKSVIVDVTEHCH